MSSISLPAGGTCKSRRRHGDLSRYVVIDGVKSVSVVSIDEIRALEAYFREDLQDLLEGKAAAKSVSPNQPAGAAARENSVKGGEK